MYPILIDIQQFSVLVIGGGRIATRKVCGLIEAGVKPTVIAPNFSDTLLTVEKFYCGNVPFNMVILLVFKSFLSVQIIQQSTKLF